VAVAELRLVRRIVLVKFVSFALRLLFVGLLAFLAYIMPWVTTFAFLRTEHPFLNPPDGETFTEWHSGLPLRFLVRNDISVGMAVSDRTYWIDAAFWFIVFLVLAVGIRYLFSCRRRGHAYV
jgi:hypothetical protein